MDSKWIVGGDDVLKRFIVSRPAPNGGASAREWVMKGREVKVFDERAQADRVAARLNKGVKS